nr:tripartite tricarboxylate transporter TctB family protein [Amylibacter sp.]
MKADRLAGPLVILSGASLFLATTQIDVLSGTGSLSARAFPFVLSGLLVLCGLILTIQPQDTPLSGVVHALKNPRTTLFASLFLLYALTFRYVDFRFGTWVFMLASMWVLGSRNWVELLVLPLSVSAIVFVLFRYGFTVLLPVWF